jgi:hypothetical protein
LPATLKTSIFANVKKIQNMFQDILVYAIVAATVCYAAYHFWKAASGKGKCNCSSCGKKCNCHKD